MAEITNPWALPLAHRIVEAARAFMSRVFNLDRAAEAWIALAEDRPTAQGVEGVVAEIAAERRRQVEVEGWTPDHDDAHAQGDMAAAAAAYAFNAYVAGAPRYFAADPRGFWPWSLSWWKPSTSRRDLVKAAALIVAEIERLDRATQGQQS